MSDGESNDQPSGAVGRRKRSCPPPPLDRNIAHSPGPAGTWHLLVDHAEGTGELARAFASPWGGGELAYRLGRDHDIGKGACAWQAGLIEEAVTGRKAPRPSHKDAGAYAFARAARREPVLLPFAGVIEGHHTGLSAWKGVRTLLKSLMKNSSPVDEAIRRVAAEMPQILDATPPTIPEWLGQEDPVRVEMLVRMTFSAVVDADRLDAAAHFRPGTRPRADADMVALWERFEKRRQAAIAERRRERGPDGQEPSWLDKLREEIYQEALEAAAGAPGIYRLHLPTGAGKTYAGGGFALRHAASHGMRRVVVAVPFISITEQNAAVYRELLDPERGPRAVLEHHSAVDVESRSNRWAKLAAENWDAPFIVTTTVRLIESLFGNRPSDVRRLHRLANSVIVLDEVQALPDQLLTPILSGLRELVEHYGVTLVLSSATQPELAELNPWRSDLPQRDIVATPAPLFEQLRRVRYEWRTDPDVTLGSIASEASDHRQALVVVNGTKDANRIHAVWQESRDSDPGVLHLSTRMTGAHRRAVIATAKRRLKGGLVTHLVSTSLIEAGVDLDFPRGYRARSLPESEQQAAGRVNREGRHAAEESVMVIFEPADGLQPHVIYNRCGIAAAARRFGPTPLKDPDDLDTLRTYYEHRYRMQAGRTATDPNGATGETIEALRAKLDFPQVADRMQMIDNEHSAPVVVIRPQLDQVEKGKARTAIRELRDGIPTPETYRALQDHTASIPRRELDNGIAVGHAAQITGELYEWVGPYHSHRGIEPDQA
ncbi:CRISPR-associated endonuclease Cas3'' [Streptomyces nigrescens]|uniref:CRISPR-associated endonuclease Cas3 n=1 Tax=Streptomyces nigrescens TaxID=1920 RepID=A0A640TUB2_STRNI|nr:CRISPR-associated endonuclease Cas3'' [Streptomyces libani]WAU00032.1 CRISPR-associated endonuclease Cas3'' [Streptomyces libani subsp. libani]GFE25756.1 CRISPR-associated helicase/endonuclease Cas3 [Streptomyces libani subsp. libani]GGV98955.1 CRISPR-associated helicase/endonuclease Cas3 [Streptomyces libani subsp. libani]